MYKPFGGDELSFHTSGVSRKSNQLMIETGSEILPQVHPK